jgi:hypothetical protein
MTLSLPAPCYRMAIDALVRGHALETASPTEYSWLADGGTGLIGGRFDRIFRRSGLAWRSMI